MRRPEGERKRTTGRRVRDAVDNKTVDHPAERTATLDQPDEGGKGLGQFQCLAANETEDPLVERRVPQDVPFRADAELIQKRHEHQGIEDMRPDVVVPDILQHEDEHKGDDHIAAYEDPETDAQPPEHEPVA